MTATVNTTKASGASFVNVGGIVGSHRYLTTEQNTVTGTITTNCTLDSEGALNVGGRIDVYYTLQILAYTSIATTGARENVQKVTVNGESTDVVIADAVSEIPNCWYIAKGDQLNGVAPSNIEVVIAAYGSYIPLENLQDGIIYVMNAAPEASE